MLPSIRANVLATFARHSEEMLAQSRVVLLDGHPIAAWGCLSLWPGVYSVWAWLTAACSPWSVPLIRLARDHLALAHEWLPAHRIQAETPCSLPSGVRWARLVGFEVEGRLRRYTAGGSDCWLLASVRGD